MADGKFHHGNLRTALIDLAIADLAGGGTVATLSLRDLAERLGVSTGAPYRHFASKDALLRAVAAEGHSRVLAAYKAAEAMTADATERLRMACDAYLDLAFGNPGLFNLIFFTEIYTGRSDAPPHEEGSAFAVFERLVAGARDLENPAMARRAAVAIWSLLHGFATLHAHGRIDDIAPHAEMRRIIVDAACTIG